MLLALPVALRALLRPDLEVYDDRDERLFHLPTTQGFAEALPTPDLSDYASATGPLYHLILAPLHAATDGALLPLRAMTLVLALGLLVAAAGIVARGQRLSLPQATVLLAPLALSPYFLGPAVRLSTDDTALLFVVGALWAADRARQQGLALAPFAAAALLAAAAVWTRQVHGWLVGALGLLALLTPGVPLSRRAGAALLALLPVAAFAPLVVLWGGPTPPSFAEHAASGDHGLLNPAVLQTELAVLGGLGLATAPWLLRALGRPGLVMAAPAAVLVGVSLLVIAPLPFVQDDLAYGGSLWRLSSKLPDLFGSAVLFWGLVPLGALWMGAFAEDGRRRRDPLPAAALGCFLAANMVSARAYQKYYEPFLLLALAWLVSRQPPAGARWWWLGPVGLTVAWAGIALVRFVV